MGWSDWNIWAKVGVIGGSVLGVAGIAAGITIPLVMTSNKGSDYKYGELMPVIENTKHIELPPNEYIDFEFDYATPLNITNPLSWVYFENYHYDDVMDNSFKLNDLISVKYQIENGLDVFVGYIRNAYIRYGKHHFGYDEEVVVYLYDSRDLNNIKEYSIASFIDVESSYSIWNGSSYYSWDGTNIIKEISLQEFDDVFYNKLPNYIGMSVEEVIDNVIKENPI